MAFGLGLAFAALVLSIVTRLLVWAMPRGATGSPWVDFGLAWGSLSADFLLLSAIVIVLAFLKNRDGVSSWSSFGTGVCIFASLIIILLSVANYASIAAMNSPFDFGWLRYLNGRDMETVGAMGRSVLTPKKIALYLILAIIVPVCCVIAAKRFQTRLTPWHLLFCLAPLLASSLIASALTAGTPDPLRDRARRSVPLIEILQNNLFPSATLRMFNGDTGPFQGHGAEVKSDEFSARSPGTASPCCPSMNIVHITIDSVARKSLSRDTVLKNKASLPNFARLYQSGISFSAAYTNRPTSDAALAIMALSRYPSHWAKRTKERSYVALDGASLPNLLVSNGYQAAHFMSGQADYGGSADIMRRWGFSKVKGSRDIPCGPDDKALIAVYSHNGDHCTAKAAADWITQESRSPFYFWLWLTNPHTPYFNSDDQWRKTRLDNQERHRIALRETDAAIGQILAVLDQKGLTEKTIIIVSADHGEAFGEHGYIFHATAIYEEQVSIPMIFVAPNLQRGVVNDTPVSLLDLAPTLAWQIGLTAPPEWKGTSFFAPIRPERVYFNSTLGGRMAGFREGQYKYLMSEDFDFPLRYDLSIDPDEQHPLILKGPEAKRVAAHVGAFLKN